MAFLAPLIALLSVSLAVPATAIGQEKAVPTFDKAKMFVTEQYKMKQKDVKLAFTDKYISVLVKGESGPQITIPYTAIKEASYEYSSERRWGAAVLVSGLFLLSKGKKHWFTLVQGTDKPEETVFQLDKNNYANILAAFEKASGQKVRMLAEKK
jgi:predicted DNA-binding protein (MmcQ/YjbR family)